MDLLSWLSRLGIPVPASPDLNAIVAAAALIAIALFVGWLVKRFTTGPLGHRIEALGGDNSAKDAKLAVFLLAASFAAFILLIGINAGGFIGIALLLLSLSLGMVCAAATYRVARRFALGALPSLLVAGIILLFVTAGAAGGLEPLLDILESIGFSVGQRRFSILAALITIAVFAGLLIAARIANHLLILSVGRMSKLEITQRVLLQKLGGIAIIAITILIAIDFAGIDLTALTVFSGAAGLAVGFGLQKTFGNLIAGLILLMDRSIKPGDIIVVADTFGSVSKIGVRAVSVVTRDGKEHLIPNEQLMTQEVENWSYSSRHVRIHIPVGVSYGCDMALAQKLMIEAAKASPRALKTPPPSLWMTGYGDSSVDHEILVWIGDPEQGVGNVTSDVLNRLWVLFKDNGIEIPFPQRDIHIRSTVPMVQEGTGKSDAK